MKSKFGVLFFGYRDAGYLCLEYLINNHADIAAVVVPAGDNGKDTWSLSVRRLAQKHNLLILSPDNLRAPEFDRIIRDLSPAIMFSCYYPKIIPGQILKIAGYGGINFHGGLLPKYRGCFSGAWAIINDEKVSGVTMHYMEPEIDTGGIIAVNEIEITNDDTALSLYSKVSGATVSLFKEKYPLLIKQGLLPSVPQEHNQANYYGRSVPFDGKIVWSKRTREVYNLIRALYFPPFKPAITNFKGKEILVWQAKGTRLEMNNELIMPGEIVGADPKEGIFVRTLDGAIAINKAGLSTEDNPMPNAHDLIMNGTIKIGDILF